MRRQNPEIVSPGGVSLKPITEASIGVFEQKGGDRQGLNGISILTQKHTSTFRDFNGRNEGRVVFGTAPDDSAEDPQKYAASGQIVYDHVANEFRFVVNGKERVSITEKKDGYVVVDFQHGDKTIGSINVNKDMMQVAFRNSNAIITSGVDDPNGNVTANPGSLYLRSNGKIYMKSAGSKGTGWKEVLTN